MIRIYIDGHPAYEYAVSELENIIATTPTISENSVLRKYMNTLLERRKRENDWGERMVKLSTTGDEGVGVGEEEEEKPIEISVG